MRTVGVGILLFFATLFGLVASAVFWANSTIFDTDEFVETASSVYRNEDVQIALADRLTTRIVEQGDLEGRIESRLPDGMEFLAAPLTENATDVIFRATLRVLQSEEILDLLDASLRLVHAQMMAILEDDSGLVIQDDAIILDLQTVVENVLIRLGVDDPEGLLSGLDLPEDAGQIVLVDDASTVNMVKDLVGLRNAATFALIAATLIFFAAAIILSKNRRSTIRTSLVLVIVIGLLGLVMLAPIRGIVAGFAENEPVAREVFNDLVFDYRVQSFLIVVAGVIGLVILFATGPSKLATNARGAVRSQADETGELRPAIIDALPWLRAAGLVTAGLAIVFWPDPTTRVYVTTLLLLAAYLGLLWLVASDMDWAVRSRAKASGVFGKVSVPSPKGGGWVARQATKLRIGGVIGGLILLIVWPTLTVGSAAGIVVLVLVYMAGIDYFAGKSSDSEEPDTASTPVEPAEEPYAGDLFS